MTNSNQFDGGRYAIGTGGRIGRRGGIAAILARFLATVIRGQDRLRQRRHLGRLDDRLLRDIGVTREEVFREIRQSPWRG